MDNNLLIYTAIVVVVVIACAVWIIWKLRKNSIHIMEELDDESDHNQKNLKTINENVIETNELLKTYNKVVEEKTAELKKYRDGGELAKEKGLFNSLIEILEFIKKFSETSDNLDERTKNYIIAIKDKLDIVLTNSGIEQFNPELNQKNLRCMNTTILITKQ